MWPRRLLGVGPRAVMGGRLRAAAPWATSCIGHMGVSRIIAHLFGSPYNKDDGVMCVVWFLGGA